MVNRKISKEKYVLAGFITFLIFFSGISLGIILDNARLKDLQFTARKQEADYNSLQFMYFFISNIDEDGKNCNVLRTALDKTTAELGESLDEFVDFKKNTRLNQRDYDLVGRKYLIDNIRYWFFAKQAKEDCDMDLVNIVYFYSGEHCASCPDQGVILTYFKKIYDEQVLIFPIDTDFEDEEPLVKLLKSNFNVTSYPTLIVDGEKFEGVVDKDRLGGLICGGFRSKEACA